MEFDEYQARAESTDTTAGKADQKYILPLLGLAGEAATLLSAYKKHLRDGPAYTLYKEEVAEELGDTLWYLSTVAGKCLAGSRRLRRSIRRRRSPTRKDRASRPIRNNTCAISGSIR